MQQPRKRGPKSAITEEMIPLIQKLHADGHAATFIAKQLGVKPKALYLVMHRLGLEVTRHAQRSSITSEQGQDIVAAYKAGWSTAALGQKYGVNDQTIGRLLRKHGVEVRPMGFQRGEGHHDWKGGLIITGTGYVGILVHPEDPFFDMGQEKMPGYRYVLEHRLVVARAIGRSLREDETVHHIDNNPLNNELSNLQLRSGKHGKGAIAQCRACGSHDIIFVPIASTTKRHPVN